MPHISPDEQYISFNYGGNLGSPGTLHIIDRSGQSYGDYPNSYVLDWRPNSSLAVNEILETGENRLVYTSLDGTIEPVFLAPAGTEITGSSWNVDGGGRWSPDGRFFIFAAQNNNSRTGQVYLWQPGNGEPILIYTTGYDKSVANFI